jgi:tetratricopeptide (TPR) repeat protein
LLSDQQRFKEAAESYRVALRLRPQAVEIMNDLAATLAQTGDFASAIDWYRKALEFQPHDPNIHFNLALALERQGDTDAAIECYLRILQLAPAHAAARARFSEWRG